MSPANEMAHSRLSAHDCDIADTLAMLQHEFLSSLDERICRIETAWITTRRETDFVQDADGIVEFELHRIAGIAGSLGLAEIGARAQALEQAVSSVKNRQADMTYLKAMDARVSAFLDHLEQHLHDI